MTIDSSAPRSRRALLAAAAGSAAAVVASAALPLTAAAASTAVMSEVDTATALGTSITNSGGGTSAFAGNATGTGEKYGLQGTSVDAAGLFAWSVSPPTSYWPEFTSAETSYVGVFGSSPTLPDPTYLATGVWGDSPDCGVYGSGGYGVIGFGAVGVNGRANSGAGSIGVLATAPSTSQTALKVTGKVSFSRAGRSNIASGQSTLVVNLAGTATNSRVFAVLAANRSGRYVRAVVPAANKFTIYLNTTVTSTTAVAWFVLDY